VGRRKACSDASLRGLLKALRPAACWCSSRNRPCCTELIAEMHHFMRDAGFAQTRLLHFPQPIYPSGWLVRLGGAEDRPAR